MHSEVLFDFLIVFFKILKLKNMSQPLKMSVSCTRNAHFHKIAFFDFDCHFDEKKLKNRSKIDKNLWKMLFKIWFEIWLIFLLIFDGFWPPKWRPEIVQERQNRTGWCILVSTFSQDAPKMALRPHFGCFFHQF